METKIGLVTYIEIHCETEEQILTNLMHLHYQIKTRLTIKGEFSKIEKFNESSIYGEHTCTISEDLTGVAV